MDKRVRLFFALWPTSAVRKALDGAIRGVIAREAGGARPTASDQLHVTLLFVGDVAPDQLDVAREVGAAVAGAPMRLRLDQLGSFVSAHVWWIGMREPPDELEALAQRLREEAQRRGLVQDAKPFAPHVTFLRRAKSRLPVQSLPPIDWHAHEFVLVQSSFSGSGSSYEIVERWPLAGD